MNKLSATIVTIGLALAVSACGGATPPSSSADASAPAGQQIASTELAAATYQMTSLNGKDTAEAAAELINSGYTEAPYQLVLFDDGGGLIYDGRTIGAVTYTPTSLSIDGRPAQLTFADGQILVEWGSNELVFDAAGKPSPARAINTDYIGTFRELDDEEDEVGKLTLKKTGMGSYQQTGSPNNKETVFWGSEQLLGTNYLVLGESLYTMNRTQELRGDKTVIILNAKNVRTGAQKRFLSTEDK